MGNQVTRLVGARHVDQAAPIFPPITPSQTTIQQVTTPLQPNLPQETPSQRASAPSQPITPRGGATHGKPAVSPATAAINALRQARRYRPERAGIKLVESIAAECIRVSTLRANPSDPHSATETPSPPRWSLNLDERSTYSCIETYVTVLEACFENDISKTGPFAPELLYDAIEQDHRERHCICPVPKIWYDIADARISKYRGLFTFVQGRSGAKYLPRPSGGTRWGNVSVFINPGGRNHCICRKRPLSVRPIVSRKRKAEDDEVEIRRQEEEPVQMRGQVAGIPVVGQMGNTALATYRTVNNYATKIKRDIVEHLRRDAQRNPVVKRFRRQACLPLDNVTDHHGKSLAHLAAESRDQLLYFTWAQDITKYIGYDGLIDTLTLFQNQSEDISETRVAYGDEKFLEKQTDCKKFNIGLCKSIYRMMAVKYGVDSVKHFSEAMWAWHSGASNAARFIRKFYLRSDILPALRRISSTVPSQLPIMNFEERQRARDAGDFLHLLLTEPEIMPLSDTAKTCFMKIIVDIDAIHKQEAPPSLVDWPGKHDDSIPGAWPSEFVQEVDCGDLLIEPVYNCKHISSDDEIQSIAQPSTPESGSRTYLQSRKHGVKRQQGTSETAEPARRACTAKVVTPRRPKGILKRAPVSPWTVQKVQPSPMKTTKATKAKKSTEATEAEKREIHFVSPVAGFQAPRHQHIRLSKAHLSRKQDIPLDEELYYGVPDETSDEDEYGDLYDPMDIDIVAPGTTSDGNARQQEPLRSDLNTQPGDVSVVEHDAELRVALPRPSHATPVGQSTYRLDYDYDTSDLTDENSFQVAEPQEAAQVETPVASSSHESDDVTQTVEAVAESRPDRTRSSGLDLLVFHDSIVDSFGRIVRIGEEGWDDSQALIDSLRVSDLKRDERDINLQLRSEIEAAARRDAAEREKRRHEEAERRRAEEERARLEEERRREAEARRQQLLASVDKNGLRSPARPLIAPITTETQARVMATLAARPDTELAHTLEGTALKRRDFEKVVPETVWLNDDVIIGSLLYLGQYVNDKAGADVQTGAPKCAAMTSFFYTRLRDQGPNALGRLMRRANIRKNNFLDIDTILIPICEHSHWTLAVVRPQRRAIAHLDSLRPGGGNGAVLNRVMEWVKVALEEKFVADEWTAESYNSPEQLNGYDCGVFTITNAMCMGLGLNPARAYTSGDMPLQRQRIAGMLLNGGFSGEFDLSNL